MRRLRGNLSESDHPKSVSVYAATSDLMRGDFGNFLCRALASCLRGDTALSKMHHPAMFPPLHQTTVNRQSGRFSTSMRGKKGPLGYFPSSASFYKQPPASMFDIRARNLPPIHTHTHTHAQPETAGDDSGHDTHISHALRG